MDPDGNLKALEEECMCSICLHRIKDVATLNCGHSHCGRCLEPLVRPLPLPFLQANQERRANIKCPICREVHHFHRNETIQSLQQDAAIVSKLAVLEKARPKAKEIVLEICQNCRFTDHKNAVYKCLSCDASLCQECLDKHNSQAERKEHFIVLLKEGESGKSILLCKKHSLRLKYFCNDCQQLICTDCVLGEHKQHKNSTLDQGRGHMYRTIKYCISSTSPKFRNADKKMHEAFSNCLKKIEGQEEVLRKTIKERKTNILKQVTESLDSVEQQLMSSYHKKLWEFQSSLQPKIDAIRRKQQKISSIDRTLESACKGSDLSFLVKAEHLKTSIKKIDTEGITELKYGLEIDAELVTKEMTKDHLFGIVKYVIGDLKIHDVLKGTSEVIPIQLEEGVTRVDKETMCKMSDDENEIMKLIDESRDLTSSNKQTNGGRNGDNSKSSSTKSVAPGSSTQTRGTVAPSVHQNCFSGGRGSYKETNERGANDAKRARLEDKTDQGFSTKPKPESELKIWSSEEARDYMSNSQQSEASSSDESHSPRMVANSMCYRCCRTNHDF